MDARGAKKIQGQKGLGKQTVPFSNGKSWVSRHKHRNEMILEGANSTLSCVDAMFVGWDKLESNIVFLKGQSEVSRALVVQDVQCRSMTLVQ